MTPYSETPKRSFQSLLVIAIMELWVKGFGILFHTLGILGKGPRGFGHDSRDWMLFGAEMLAPALILIGFYWKLLANPNPPKSTRLAVCGWIFSTAFHAFMAVRFSSQVLGLPFFLASAWAALMSAYLAMACALPSQIAAFNLSLAKARAEGQSLRDLRMVSFLVLLWGALHLGIDLWRGSQNAPVDVAWGMNGRSINFDASDLGVLIFAGLWLRRKTARTFAVWMSWYWLIGAVFLAFELFPVGGVTVTSNSDHLALIPRNILRGAVFPFLLLQLWQLHVLRRTDVRALFVPSVRPPPLPATPISEDSASQAHGA